MVFGRRVNDGRARPLDPPYLGNRTAVEPNCRGNGFTLVEVSLAVCIVAAGLLVLFGLFPMGLQLSEYAVLDTQEAMFADTVFSIMEANAMAIESWDTWSDPGTPPVGLLQALMQGMGLDGLDTSWSSDGTGGWKIEDVAVGTGGIEFPKPKSGSDPTTVPRYMRYRVRVAGAADSPMKSVELWARCSKYGDFDTQSSFYFTQIFYSGM